MRIKLISALILILTIISCENNNKYLRVILTGEVNDIDNTGVLLKGYFYNTTSEAITDYGFSWGINDDYAHTIHLNKQLVEGKFTYRIEGDLVAGQIYKVRAFLVKDGNVSFGAPVSFLSAGSNSPVLTDFSPKTVFAGDTIYITGKYFSDLNSDNEVFVNNEKLLTVSSEEGHLKVLVPYNAVSKKDLLSIKVAARQGVIADTLTIRPTWLLTAKNVFLRNDVSESGLNGFYSDGNLYLRYEDAYAGFFRYTIATGNVVSLTDYAYYNIPSYMYPFGETGCLFFPGHKICIYNKEADLWMPKLIFPGGNREGGVGFTIGTDFYFGTGHNTFSDSYLKDFWKYDSVNNTWTRMADFPGEGRVFATSFVYNNKGFVGLGGRDIFYNRSEYNDIWQYDPATNIWVKFATPVDPLLMISAVSLAYGDKLLIGVKEFFEYNFTTGRWRRIGDFPGSYNYSLRYNIPYVDNGEISIASLKNTPDSSGYFSTWKLTIYE